MEIKEKGYINHSLKQIFEKSQEALGMKNIEKYIKKILKVQVKKKKKNH